MEDYRSPHEQELLDAIKAIEDCDEQREFARTLLEIRRLPCAVLLDHTLYKLGELEV